MEKSSQQDPSFGQGLELAGTVLKAIASTVKKNGSSLDEVQKIVGKPGVVFKLVEDLFAKDVEQKSSMLSLISVGEKVMIEALDGKAYIADAKQTFRSFIDGNFKSWGLNKSGPATLETLVDIHEVVEDGNLVKIFTSLNPDLEKVVMTQAQIIRFCEKHPTWLRREGYGTFFLTKVSDEYVVVFVSVNSGGLLVYVDRLGNADVLYGRYRYRVVSPQLIALSV